MNWQSILRRKEWTGGQGGETIRSHPLTWVHLDTNADIRCLQMSTEFLLIDLHVRYRDLVVVDPTIAVPMGTVIFIRPTCIVLNLDVGGHIRMVICENQVFILGVPDERDTSVSAIPTVEHPFVRHLSTCLKRQASDSMPYELIALEAALNTAVGILTKDVDMYDDLSMEKIDAMLRSVNRDTLEGIRNIKHAVNVLQLRVSRLQMEIQEIMEDDIDMADLYLKKRRKKMKLKKPPFPPTEEKKRKKKKKSHRKDGHDAMWKSGKGNGLRLYRPFRPRRYGRRILKRAESGRHPDDMLIHRRLAHKQQRRRNGNDDDDDGFSAAGDAMQGTGQPLLIDPHEIEEAEDLLEAIFVDCDILSRRLAAIEDRAKDAEGLLELDLDQRRNELVGLNLVVATIAMAFGFGALIAGVFGMNLVNSDLVDEAWVLPVVLVVTLVLCVALIGAVVWYVRKRKLMFIPTTL